jgi:hypothetical protein
MVRFAWKPYLKTTGGLKLKLDSTAITRTVEKLRFSFFERFEETSDGLSCRRKRADQIASW